MPTTFTALTGYTTMPSNISALVSYDLTNGTITPGPYSVMQITFSGEFTYEDPEPIEIAVHVDGVLTNISAVAKLKQSGGTTWSINGAGTIQVYAGGNIDLRMIYPGTPANPVTCDQLQFTAQKQ